MPTAISNLSQYLDAAMKNGGKGRMVFRGQRRDLPLLPRLARLSLRGENLLLEERHMLREFSRRALPHLEFTPGTDADMLAVAQHHGLATRLLDWTYNPLAALWFAVSQAAEKGKSGVVWILRLKDEDFITEREKRQPFSLAGTKIFEPGHASLRIAAQSGCFTVHAALRNLRKGGAFLPLEKNRRYSTCLSKLEIPAAAFPALRRDLDICGVNSAALFPGLDGLGRHVDWQHSKLADEA